MMKETKYFQRTFRKPRRVPLMPGGDDELGSHLMTKWFTEASVCCFQNGLVEVATVIPTLHAQPLYPYMGKGIIDYLDRY